MIFLIYYKVKIDDTRFIEDNYEIVAEGNKLKLEDINRFKTTVIRMFGVSPVIMNIMSLEV